MAERSGALRRGGDKVVTRTAVARFVFQHRSGFVWQDNDRDNVVDAGETRPNIAVTLAIGPECRNIIGLCLTGMSLTAI